MDTAFGQGMMKITEKISDIILTPIVWLLTGAAIIMFLYGLVVFLANNEDSSEKEAGKKHMLYGMAGLLIIFAVWGIINFIGATVNSIR